jgi:hypothetical protein
MALLICLILPLLLSVDCLIVDRITNSASRSPYFLNAVNKPFHVLDADPSSLPISNDSSSRRHILQQLVIVPMVVATDSATAAPPITVEETESWQARALRLVRPKPPKLLRPKLQQDFAVLLMRTSYNVLDELDCVPMDQVRTYCECIHTWNICLLTYANTHTFC